MKFIPFTAPGKRLVDGLDEVGVVGEAKKNKVRVWWALSDKAHREKKNLKDKARRGTLSGTPPPVVSVRNF